MRDFVDVDLHRMRLELAVELYESGELARNDVDLVLREAVWMGALHCPRGETIWEVYRAFLEKGGESVESKLNLVEGCMFLMGEEVKKDVEMFEEKLGEAREGKQGEVNQEKVMRYRLYAAYAKRINEGLAISIYERFVRECFAEGEAWAEYVRYSLSVKREGFSQFVAQRAIRNVPWQMSVWQTALLSVRDAKELSEMLGRVTAHVMGSEDYSGAEMLCKIAWSVFLAIGGTVEAKEEVLKSLDFNVIGSVNWAKAYVFAAGILVEAGEVDEAVRLMEKVVEVRWAESRWWIEFARVLGRGKDPEYIRNVFGRGLGLVTSRKDVDELAHTWLTFECRCEERDDLTQRVARVQATVTEKLDSFGGAQRIGFGRAEDIIGGKNGREKNKGRNLPKRKRTKTLNVEKEGRKENGTDGTEGDEMGGSLNGDVFVSKAVKTGLSSVKGEKRSSQGQSTANGEAMEVTGSKDESIIPEGTEPRTIFINNLAFNVSESELREEFSFAGSITSVRLPRRSDGAPKGIAYIEFGDEKDVEKALNKHQTPIKGRVVWVRRSKPPARKQRMMMRAQPRKSVRTKTVESELMQPRAVQRRTVVEAPNKNEADEDVSMEDERAGEGSEPKSQADFRAMFLQK